MRFNLNILRYMPPTYILTTYHIRSCAYLPCRINHTDCCRICLVKQKNLQFHRPELLIIIIRIAASKLTMTPTISAARPKPIAVARSIYTPAIISPTPARRTSIINPINPHQTHKRLKQHSIAWACSSILSNRAFASYLTALWTRFAVVQTISVNKLIGYLRPIRMPTNTPTPSAAKTAVRGLSSIFFLLISTASLPCSRKLS